MFISSIIHSGIIYHGGSIFLNFKGIPILLKINMIKTSTKYTIIKCIEVQTPYPPNYIFTQDCKILTTHQNCPLPQVI